MKSSFAKSGAFALTLLASALAYGCGDSGVPMEPSAVPAHGAPSFALGEVTAASVPTVRRSTPLTSDITASAYINRSGGVIEIPEAGFKMVIPHGAVKSKTLITVTAPAGDAVGYSFQPHGIQFLEPVRIEQVVSGTSAEGSTGLNLIAAYVGGEGLTSAPSVLATEILSTEWIELGKKIRFNIFHFSGYIVGVG